MELLFTTQTRFPPQESQKSATESFITLHFFIGTISCCNLVYEHFSLETSGEGAHMGCKYTSAFNQSSLMSYLLLFHSNNCQWHLSNHDQ